MTKSSKVLRKIISDFYMVLILLFLYAPILTMMVLSFNKSKSRTQWGGFTLQWYTQMFDSRSIMSALTTTLIIAFVSALVATVHIHIIITCSLHFCKFHIRLHPAVLPAF